MKDNQIKERVKTYGVQSLLDYEAIHLLTNIPIDKLILYNSLSALNKDMAYLDITDLQRQKLEIMFHLIKRFSQEKFEQAETLTSPEAVYNLMAPKLKSLDHEEFHIILLDCKCRMIKEVCVSIGTLTGSLVHPREIFKYCIQYKAHSFIAIHNHPSGDATESREDLIITKRLKDTGEIMGIFLVDHIIIGNTYNSLKKKGKL